MTPIIIVEQDRLQETSRHHVTYVHSIDECHSDNRIYAMEPRNIDMNNLPQHNKTLLYLPANNIAEVKSMEHVKVYFDLEVYPFFQKCKDLILSRRDRRGVLRFRRVIDLKEKEHIIWNDLYVLATIFGTPEQVFVKQRKNHPSIRHIILTVSFECQTMAHIEYTFSQEKVAVFLEWSGINCVVECDSNEINPISSSHGNSSSLLIDVDLIKKEAHCFDYQLLSQLATYQNLLNGGDIK